MTVKPQTEAEKAKLEKIRFPHFHSENLENPNYPIGHGTGMNGKDWRKFATKDYPAGRFNSMGNSSG